MICVNPYTFPTVSMRISTYAFIGFIPYPTNTKPITKKAKKIERSDTPKMTFQEVFTLFSIFRNPILTSSYEMATITKDSGHFHEVVEITYLGSPGHAPTTPFTAYSIVSR